MKLVESGVIQFERVLKSLCPTNCGNSPKSGQKFSQKKLLLRSFETSKNLLLRSFETSKKPAVAPFRNFEIPDFAPFRNF